LLNFKWRKNEDTFEKNWQLFPEKVHTHIADAGSEFLDEGQCFCGPESLDRRVAG
jgi:hypothetical protein